MARPRYGPGDSAVILRTRGPRGEFPPPEYPLQSGRKLRHHSFIPCGAPRPQDDNRHQNTYTPRDAQTRPLSARADADGPIKPSRHRFKEEPHAVIVRSAPTLEITARRRRPRPDGRGGPGA